MEIEVIESLMGNGKTHATLRYIEGHALSNPEARWIYCTEYLDEIDRRTAENDAAKHLWRTPDDDDKVEKFVELLKEPKVQLIAVTHALLMLASRNKYINHLLKSKGYNLFLDETIELINPYTNCLYGDFLIWMAEGKFNVGEQHGKVEWVYEDSLSHGLGTSFTRLSNDAKRGVVYCSIVSGGVGSSVSLVEVEDEIIFTQFGRVLVATYQIEYTLFDAYLQIKGLKRVVCKDVVCSRHTTKSRIASLITFLNKHDKKFEGKSLSSNWWEGKGKDGANKDDYRLVNNTIRNIGDTQGCKGSAHLLGFTVPASKIGSARDAKSVYPRGYPHTVCYMEVDENGEEVSTGVTNKTASTYIPCNARASNAYAEKSVMVHVYNRYPLLGVTRYLDAHKIPYSSEAFALNELLQWVWRSAIRNGEPIKLAILSSRMRGLFKSWLSAA